MNYELEIIRLICPKFSKPLKSLPPFRTRFAQVGLRNDETKLFELPRRFASGRKLIRSLCATTFFIAIVWHRWGKCFAVGLWLLTAAMDVWMFRLCFRGKQWMDSEQLMGKNIRTPIIYVGRESAKKGLRVRGEAFWLSHFVKES